MRLNDFAQTSLVSILLTIFGTSAVAQTAIDPSSALLLKNGQNGQQMQTRESGVDSGRYTVRPRPAVRHNSELDGPAPQWQTPASEPSQPIDWELATPETEFQASEPSPMIVAPTPTAATTPSAASNAPPEAAPAPNARTPMVPLVQVPPRANTANYDFHDDRRWTLLEFSLAPAYIYTDSSSDYTFRRYSVSSPAAAVDARVWFRPTFAFDTSYMTTLSSSVSDSDNNSRRVTAAQDLFTIGLRGRKFFGTSRMAPTLVFGLDYNEYQFRVPSDAVMRGKAQTSGARISVESDIPANFYRSWTLGVFLAPKQQHSEGGTNAGFLSGGNVEANTVGISLGGKFSYDHSSSLFWKLSHSVEKDLFSGDATKADPLTGVKPTNVSVTNSLTVFSLGFTWGS